MNEEKEKVTIHNYTLDNLKSETISTVDSRGSLRSRLPSTVTMSVSHRFAAEAQGLVIDLKDGITRESGLVGLKLIAVYADEVDEVEKVVSELNLELEGEEE